MGFDPNQGTEIVRWMFWGFCIGVPVGGLIGIAFYHILWGD